MYATCALAALLFLALALWEMASWAFAVLGGQAQVERHLILAAAALSGALAAVGVSSVVP